MTKYVGQHRTTKKWTARKTIATTVAAAGLFAFPVSPAVAEPIEIPGVIGLAPPVFIPPPQLKPAPELKEIRTKIKKIQESIHDLSPTPPAQDPVEGNLGQRALAVAQQFLGWPYVGDGSTWGGTTPADGGFDCSGLVQWAYKQVGVVLPRTTWGQQTVGRSVSLGDIQPGDLVIVSGGGHVGIYAGGGKMINAPAPGQVIKLTPLSSFPITAIRRIA